jgi:hypothetical protein
MQLLLSLLLLKLKTYKMVNQKQNNNNLPMRS